jgi:hypothetical protein
MTSPLSFLFSPIGTLRTENIKHGRENIWANMIALRTLHATSLLYPRKFTFPYSVLFAT